MRTHMHLGWFWVLLVGMLCTAHAHNDAYQLVVKIQELEDRKFATQASFKLPLRSCQAWRYLTDYESSSAIPGVLSAKATRLDHHKAQLKLLMEERVLFLTVRMNSVLEFVELPHQGTDFVQTTGEAKSFQGSWRIEPNGTDTVFRYHSVFQPDSALPMVVIKYFFDRRLRSNFAAIAQIGAAQRDQACP